jgi:hypothetical protein
MIAVEANRMSPGDWVQLLHLLVGQVLGVEVLPGIAHDQGRHQRVELKGIIIGG